MSHRAAAVRAQQRLLDAQFEALLQAHHGAHVLFGDGEVVGLYASSADAFRAGLEHFGLERAFVIEHLIERRPFVVPSCWHAPSEEVEPPALTVERFADPRHPHRRDASTVVTKSPS